MGPRLPRKPHHALNLLTRFPWWRPRSRDAQYAIDAGDLVFAPGFKFLLKRASAIARQRDKPTDATLLAYARDLKRRLDRLLDRAPTSVAGHKLRNDI